MPGFTSPLLPDQQGQHRGQINRLERAIFSLIVLCVVFLFLYAHEKHAPNTPIEPVWLYRKWAPSRHRFVDITNTEMRLWFAFVVPHLVRILLLCANVVGIVSAAAISGILTIFGCVLIGFLGQEVSVIERTLLGAFIGAISYSISLPSDFLQLVAWALPKFDLGGLAGISMIFAYISYFLWGFLRLHSLFVYIAILCFCIGGLTNIAGACVVNALTRFGEEQPSLPLLFPTQEELDSASMDAIVNRWVLWALVFFCKWLMLAASSIFWHTLIIKLPLMCRKARVMSPRIPTDLSTLFVLYHMCHKLVLFALVEIALVNDWLSDHHGFDFEIWSQWMNWIIVITNVVAFCKYTLNIGVDLERPTLSVLLVFVPGIGADAHFAKDWLFIGIAFKQGQVAQNSALSTLAYVIGIASIGVLFVPTIHFLMDEKYKAQPSLAWNFVCSHWPIVGAEPALNAKRSTSGGCCSFERLREELSTGTLQRRLQEMLTEQMIYQTTPWHYDLIFTSELPQGILELLFCISSSLQPAVVIATCFSFVKMFNIQALLRSVQAFVVALGSGRHLVLYVKLHGISSDSIVSLLFDKREAESKFHSLFRDALDRLQDDFKTQTRRDEQVELDLRNTSFEFPEGLLAQHWDNIKASLSEHTASQPGRKFPHNYEALKNAHIKDLLLREMKDNPRMHNLVGLDMEPLNWTDNNRARFRSLWGVPSMSMKWGIQRWCDGF